MKYPYDKTRDILPYNSWGGPHGRLCSCGVPMRVIDGSHHSICEPAQMWRTWHCPVCGHVEYATYEDSWDPKVPCDIKPADKEKWLRVDAP